jgi:hypothetical protein
MMKPGWRLESAGLSAEAKVTVQTGLDDDMSLSIAPQERRQDQSHGERVGDTPSQSLRSSGKGQ